MKSHCSERAGQSVVCQINAHGPEGDLAGSTDRNNYLIGRGHWKSVCSERPPRYPSA